MRKETIEYTCDDCGKKSKDSKFLHVHIWKTQCLELCSNCTAFRVYHSKILIPFLLCQVCNGTGKVKDSYYHNDFQWITCPECYGTGFIKERRQ